MIRVETYFAYPSAIGRLSLGCAGDTLVRVALGDVTLDGQRKATALSNAAANEIHDYLAGKRRIFTVPFRTQGTEFQQLVWDYLVGIPYGQTRTYADVAASIGHPRSQRAVGMACNANPLPLILPCHRVVGVQGALGGYVLGRPLKQRLLELEHTHA